jgi:hypothetical protein
MYQPFWSIAEYVQLQNSEQRLGLLMRIWFQRWSDQFFYCKIPFVVSVGRREGRLTELTFFESMFGYTVKRKGRFIRIFWVPIRIGDSEGMPPDTTDNEENSGGNIADGSCLLIDRPMDTINITHQFNWNGAEQ